jgi:hypothetical protein
MMRRVIESMLAPLVALLAIAPVQAQEYQVAQLQAVVLTGQHPVFGGGIANASAMQDVTSLARHLDGCTQEFWRTLGRDHDGAMAAAIEGDVRIGSSPGPR